MFSLSLYKRNQGRLARQATFWGLAIIAAAAAYSMHNYFQGMDFKGRPRAEFIYGSLLPLIVFLTGVWFSFRIIQLPSFADFLISVEGEMNKVSWPSRGELFRASLVVMFVIFFLAGILFLYDLALAELMRGVEWGLNQMGSWFG
jgi:preprotein translocase subunit SecE